MQFGANFPPGNESSDASEEIVHHMCAAAAAAAVVDDNTKIQKNKNPILHPKHTHIHKETQKV